MNNTAYLSLGSNMGDREKNLFSAIVQLQKNKQIRIVKFSSIYETEPVGYLNQNQFLNAVIQVSTSLSPQELLKVCLKIEEKLGRKRKIRWGPRIIDLDILLYNQENIETEDLIIPHPRMFERAFVMIPLLEIEPNLEKVISYKQIKDFHDEGGVRIWKQTNGGDVFALFAN